MICDFKLRFPSTNSECAQFCGNSGDLALSTPQSLPIVIVPCWFATNLVTESGECSFLQIVAVFQFQFFVCACAIEAFSHVLPWSGWVIEVRLSFSSL